MSDSFLPKGTKIPSTSNYFKLQQGENTFRILAPAVAGFEYFNDQKKPVRIAKEPMGLPKDIGYDKDGKPNAVRYFWAFPIWNYNAERIQIAEFTQRTILTPIEGYINNGKWGDPRGYDITINKKGSTMADTEYTVMPNPKEAVNPKIEEAFKARPIDLTVWFNGGDPFSPDKNARQENGMPVGVDFPTEDIKPEDIPF